MTIIEMMALRGVLADRRAALIDRLVTDTSGEDLTAGQVIDPGFLRLLADTHTAIAAVDAELGDTTEPEGDET